MYSKYDIGRKEFAKEPSHVRRRCLLPCSFVHSASSISPKFPNTQTTLSIGNPTSKFSSFALTKPLGNSYDFTVKPEFRIIS